MYNGPIDPLILANDWYKTHSVLSLHHSCPTPPPEAFVAAFWQFNNMVQSSPYPDGLKEASQHMMYILSREQNLLNGAQGRILQEVLDKMEIMNGVLDKMEIMNGKLSDLIIKVDAVQTSVSDMAKGFDHLMSHHRNAAYCAAGRDLIPVPNAGGDEFPPSLPEPFRSLPNFAKISLLSLPHTDKWLDHYDLPTDGELGDKHVLLHTYLGGSQRFERD